MYIHRHYQFPVCKHLKEEKFELVKECIKHYFMHMYNYYITRSTSCTL